MLSFFGISPQVDKITEKCNDRNEQKAEIEIECTHQHIYDKEDVFLHEHVKQ